MLLRMTMGADCHAPSVLAMTKVYTNLRADVVIGPYIKKNGPVNRSVLLFSAI